MLQYTWGFFGEALFGNRQVTKVNGEFMKFLPGFNMHGGSYIGFDSHCNVVYFCLKTKDLLIRDIEQPSHLVA